MECETFFLISAASLLIFDLFMLATVRRNKKQEAKYGFYAAAVSFGLILASYLILLRALVSNDFSFVHVYSYSSSSLPLLSKIYAGWGGAGGSMLFLTFLLNIFYFALRVLAHRRGENFNFTASKVFNIVLIVIHRRMSVEEPVRAIHGGSCRGQRIQPSVASFLDGHPSSYSVLRLCFCGLGIRTYSRKYGNRS